MTDLHPPLQHGHTPAAEAVSAGRNVPAATARVRKVRKGRKARFNRVTA